MDTLVPLLYTAAVIAAIVVLGTGLARKLKIFRPQPKLVLRPFYFLQNDIGYDGDACTRLLKTEFAVDDPKESERKSKKRGASGTTTHDNYEGININVSLAGTRIPLSFLWLWARRIMFGAPDTFEFLVSRDGDEALLIEGWRTHDDERFFGWSNDQQGADPLRIAIRRIAEQIRAAYPRYQNQLLGQFLNESRYSDASQLLDDVNQSVIDRKWSGDLKTRAKLESQRPWILYQAGFYEAALEIFEPHANSDDENARIDCLINSFQYDEAIAALDAAGELLKSHDVLLKRAGAERGRRNLDAAMEHYVLAIEEATAAVEKKGEESIALWAVILANQGAAECLLGMNNLVDRQHFLEQQVVASSLLEKYDLSSSPAHFRAWALEDLGQYEHAIDTYNQCTEICKSERERNPDDVDYLIDHAWARAGAGASLNHYVKSMLPVMIGDEAEELENTIDLLQLISEHLSDLPKIDRKRAIRDLMDDKLDPAKIIEMTADDAQVIRQWRKDSREFKEIIGKYAERTRALEEAFVLFTNLTDRNSPTNVSEGYYGLACIYAVYDRPDLASDELMNAIQVNPALKERACWDSDFAEFRWQVHQEHTISRWDDQAGWFA